MPARPINAKPTFAERVDSLLGVFSPAWQARRTAARAAVTILGASAYRGAARDRLRGDWVASSGSADADLLDGTLETLRERARDLVRNDGFAAGMLRTLVNHTVGTGIRPQSRVDALELGIDPTAGREFSRAAERAWRRWVPFADAEHKLDAYGLQRLACRALAESGEAFLVPRRLPRQSPDGRRRPYQLALQLVEADRVSTPTGSGALGVANGNEIRGGVEINSDGQPVAYWIRKKHPGEGSLGIADVSKFMRVPRFDPVTGWARVIHLYDPQRIGQSRGASDYAPMLAEYKDFQDVMEAERITARIAACFGLVIRKTNPYNAALAATSSTNSAGQRLETIEPGMIERLEPDEDITQINPLRPGSNFEPFIARVQRNIGAGHGVPYEVAAMDYSNVNFSSARAARMDARVTFLVAQHLISRAFQAFWEMLIEEAFLLGELPSWVDARFSRDRETLTRAVWVGPGYGYVRPDQEVRASGDAIELGVSTLQDEAALLGRDWEELAEQRKRELDRLAELGLTPQATAPATSAAPPTDPNANPDDAGEQLPDETPATTRRAA